MSRLTDLIRQVRAKDPALAVDLTNEVKSLTDRRAFGLNFERHQPEAVELPQRTVRRGDKVRVLPERGSKQSRDKRLWRVVRTERIDDTRVAHLSLIDSEDGEFKTAEADDLVVVTEFRDPIYPGLKSTGRIESGADKASHIVINAENFHALQTLIYTHEGKVDCIYIDPPYNSGARDWKYNNDYVDGDDLYRHSKWLAFMERRLKLARRLLNPDDSVLIVTIDEREVHRLGLLLDQVFKFARRQMVSIVINHRGVSRNREFTRVEEYAFFVFLGEAGPDMVSDDLLTPLPEASQAEVVRWERLIKGSNSPLRIDRPNLFYPVYVNQETHAIVEVGDPLPSDVDRSSVKPTAGIIAVWPLSMDGVEKRWQCSAATLRSLVSQGLAKVGSYDRRNDRYSILYLNRGQRERIARGEIKITGRDSNGVVLAEMDGRLLRAGMTVWNRRSHNAGIYGSGILSALIPERTFPFPKSLYAVEDSLRFAVGDKPDALVLDFFAGSGTTAHALARLNKQDEGRRSSISVTNNEVSEYEAQRLTGEGLRPGDPEWEKLGICEYITKPRIQSAMTGRTPEGVPVAGDYKFLDEFPMSEGFDENVEFFDLTYETPRRVAHHRSFPAVASLLWMMAGARGRRIESLDGFAVADTYGILLDLDQAPAFLTTIAKVKSAQIAFIITNDDGRFQMICDDLPSRVQPVRLYESYLTNFEINIGRE